MKISTLITVALLATLGAGNLFAAGPKFDQAVACAAPDSGASLERICKAAYDAAKESPREADALFERILSQRKDWNASQVYAILRSILLAVPELQDELTALLNKKKAEGAIEVKDYKGNIAAFHANGEQGAEDALGEADNGDGARGSNPFSVVAANLLQVLNSSGLNPAVVENALMNVQMNSAPAVQAVESQVSNSIDINTNAVPSAPATSTDR